MRDGRQILVRGEQEANVTHEIDPVVRKVIGKLAARSTIGMSKYGVGLSRPDYSLKDWLTEIQEEALDLANYAEAAMEDLERPAPAPATGRVLDDLVEKWRNDQEMPGDGISREVYEAQNAMLRQCADELAAALASPAGAGTPEPDGLVTCDINQTPHSRWGDCENPKPASAVPQAGSHTEERCECPRRNELIHRRDCADAAPAPTVTPAAVREAIRYYQSLTAGVFHPSEPAWRNILAAAEAWAAQEGEAG